MRNMTKPIISYYGNTGEGYISACPLVTETIGNSIIPVVKETSSPVNQLYLIDLNNNQCGRIKVDNILVNPNEAVGIFVRVNSIIQETSDSKIGQLDNTNSIYTDFIRPFHVSIHVQEISDKDVNNFCYTELKEKGLQSIESEDDVAFPAESTAATHQS